MSADSDPSGFPSPQRPRVTRRRFASARTILALVLREMATTNGRSPGGYLWAILEPVAGIALLTGIFSLGFRSPSLGTSFPIFYATGVVPFQLYIDISGKVAQSLLFSRPLLAYPAVTFLDAIIARFLTNLLTQLMVAYVVLFGILLTFESRTAPDPVGIALGFAMAASLALGIGIMNAFLFTMFPIWQRIWAILNRPMFLISCIFFLLENVPEPYRDYLWWNPLVHVVGQMRASFYPTYDATYVSYPYVFGIALGLSATGLLFLRRYHRVLLNS